MALLGPEQWRPTVFYSSLFSVWRGLVGSGAELRRSPLSRCRRAAPRCQQAVSSASLLVPRGLSGAGGVLFHVVGAAGIVDASGSGTRRSRHCPLPRPRSRQTASLTSSPSL